MTDPREVFRELRQVAPAKEGRAYRAFAGPDGLQLRAFVDGVTRLPGIRIACPVDAVPTGWVIPKIRGASFSVVPLQPEAAYGVASYELVAADESFSSVFIELASSLLERAGNEATSRSALKLIVRWLATWARFFDLRGQSAIGRSAQLGLMGELLCLEELGRLVGLHRSVPAWTGPEGSPHDFQFDTGAIEVKLTTSTSPERIRITSARQLNDAVVPWLGLFAVLCQEAVSGDIALPLLVDRVRNAILEQAPGFIDLFEERLAGTGYCEADREQYTVRVAILRHEFLHVAEDFPRIRPDELRSGVSDVTYDVAWSAIMPYRIQANSVRETLSGSA